MALGEIEKRKNVRSSKTGFMFFLLLQMSLLSKVRLETITVQDTSTTVQDTSPTVQTSSPTVQASSTTVQDTSPTVQASSTTVQASSATVQASSTTVQASSTTVQASSTTVQASSTTVQAFSTTVQASSPTAATASATAESATHSMYPESLGSSTSTGQMSMSTSGSTHNNTQSTSSVSNTVSTMGSTNMNKDNSSSVTGNYSAMRCPVFDCTTDCYVQFMNDTMKSCPPGSNFCEIMTQNTSYSFKCSASCGVSCGNSTLGNCSWKCCNTTSCLNDTLLALTSSPSTTAAITSTTTTTTTKAMATSTQANNGKKCHNITCQGAACYKPISTSMLCLVGQDYCMLKKTTSGTSESWLAGCSDDCRKMPVCSTSVTTCYLECCNATTTSCLKLTGEVNMPSSATRGPHSPALLIASLLLFWILRVFT